MSLSLYCKSMPKHGLWKWYYPNLVTDTDHQPKDWEIRSTPGRFSLRIIFSSHINFDWVGFSGDVQISRKCWRKSNMKFVDSFLEFLSHSKVIHLKRDILQRRSGLSGTISRIWAVSGLVGENRFNKNQSSRTTEQKANFDPSLYHIWTRLSNFGSRRYSATCTCICFCEEATWSGDACVCICLCFVLYLSLPFFLDLVSFDFCVTVGDTRTGCVAVCIFFFLLDWSFYYFCDFLCDFAWH